ncbi:trypsin-like serine protease [Candidatus Peregrinibacteria bacterium]|jgi:serine protease Do|nr:trypsin-like serine protease [Candidatus Peregrinibacteria bacterium]MBT4631585.1 trypsin-like serine protease [Candidatus Peregrinibacteria bacterium]MBT4890821.1 trypsin-like serine protease [Rhodospirillales bacterium]MBT5517001.1 trypsin-like serine protease [Candidatus Peregrinibacteria bacterium]MBT5824118.1 trypsin-like serine protease [Candidatus Peregrinibacteria bacterium]
MKKQFYVYTALIALVFGGIGGLGGELIFDDDRPEGRRPAREVHSEATSYVDAWEDASPAVVSVVAQKDLTDYYSRFGFTAVAGPTTVSSGTGFIITADGILVTNRHVVEDDSADYVVILSDGSEIEAEVLAKDALNDIAIMQLTGDDDRIGALEVLDFADSDEVSVGEPVLAIGNALGQYSNTTTAGIISATGRQISVGNAGGSYSLVDLIQTDAAINPGNSGGPLVNIDGELVGMNTAIDSTAEGIGFAIPSNDISGVLKSYEEHGRIIRPFLGVRYIPVTQSVQQRFSLDYDYGILLLGDDELGEPAIVTGSSADKAGLLENDVILSVDGNPFTSTYTPRNSLSTLFVGDEIKLEVWRAGAILELDLLLEERK